MAKKGSYATRRAEARTSKRTPSSPPPAFAEDRKTTKTYQQSKIQAAFRALAPGETVAINGKNSGEPTLVVTRIGDDETIDARLLAVADAIEALEGAIGFGPDNTATPFAEIGRRVGTRERRAFYVAREIAHALYGARVDESPTKVAKRRAKIDRADDVMRDGREWGGADRVIRRAAQRVQRESSTAEKRAVTRDCLARLDAIGMRGLGRISRVKVDVALALLGRCTEGRAKRKHTMTPHGVLARILAISRGEDPEDAAVIEDAKAIAKRVKAARPRTRSGET